jgi:hypothetical protein
MDAQERATSPCRKLRELPPVLTEWQQSTWCPACDYHDRGRCLNPTHAAGNVACPFDGKVLPLREMVGEPNYHVTRMSLPKAVRPCGATG